MDGTNADIPIIQTPINKKKIIPNTREKVVNLKENNKDINQKDLAIM